jgi:endonuclease YncB( thermonuclease family)
LQSLAPVGAAIALRSKATDRYGRNVAELSRGGRNLNQALVASGAAFVYWQTIGGCDRQTYGRLETEARMKGLGVWSTPGGITRPWDVRRGHRRASTTDHTEAGTSRRDRSRQIASHARAQELLREPR